MVGLRLQYLQIQRFGLLHKPFFMRLLRLLE